MKSLIQEASTILKAVEKAWHNAGKPDNFSIKIYEQPERNFIGLTTKAAKVGIFFGTEKEPEHRTKKTSASRKDEHKGAQKKRVHKEATQEQRKQQQQTPQSQQQDIWTSDMINFVNNWLGTMLKAMQKDVQFNVEAKNYYLHCSFAKPLVAKPEKERAVYRALSMLLLQTLKKKFHRPLRGYKVVLRSEKS